MDSDHLFSDEELPPDEPNRVLKSSRKLVQLNDVRSDDKEPKNKISNDKNNNNGSKYEPIKSRRARKELEEENDIAKWYDYNVNDEYSTDDSNRSKKSSRKSSTITSEDENTKIRKSSSKNNLEKKKRQISRSASMEAKKENQEDTLQDKHDLSHSTSHMSLRGKSAKKTESSDMISINDIDDSVFEDSEAGDIFEQDKTGQIQKIISHKGEGDDAEYFVKLHGLSYKDCQWIPKLVVTGTRSGEIMLKKYIRKHKNDPPKDPLFDPSYIIPEKIIGSKEDDGKTLYLVKWTNLEYDQNTWESAESLNNPKLIKDFNELNELPPREYRIAPPPPSASNWRAITGVPPSKHGYTIRPYQLEGLNFLASSWVQRHNAILADEMGLGKTLQSLVFLEFLNREMNVHGPFLVIVPLSTIGHWEREISEWTTMRFISFFGCKERRQSMYQYEFFYPGTHIPKFQIMLTTYEYVIAYSDGFRSVEWEAIVIDEAHRLKNTNSRLLNELRKYSTNFKLLLTGTPLQNNIGELWSLLNYLDEDQFQSLSEFQSNYGQLSEGDQITELQAILRPIMLRRLKGDVEKDIAPLEEVIIECAMTKHQKLYYQSLYTRNIGYLSRGVHRQNAVNLNNIFMELRKVCNHPYLIHGAEEQILIERREAAHFEKPEDVPPNFEDKALIKSSGKMILLNKLLKKLKADNHRVLIFSQMSRMLDIIQDYLNFKEYKYERIDGAIKGDERQAGIDRFNAPDSDVFVFLLCTHAGGLGINLTSADTVIIYDSDWNPQNDIQATARCHRIGQTKEVKVYRFITAKSYERKMFDRAAIKLGLDHAVLESNKIQKAEEIEKLLRLGAYYAFEDDNGEDAEKFGKEDIDSIISRSTKIRHENIGAGDGSTFSKATFELDDDDDVDVSAPDFWQKYLPEVVEDDIDDGVSIAMRRRMKREGSSFDPMPFELDMNMDLRNPRDFEWTKKRVQILMVNMWRFGWGRWRVIYQHTRFYCEIGEMKAVAHCILSWLCDAAPNQFPLMEAIYRRSEVEETRKFEYKFLKKRREELYPTVAQNAIWRLSRLEQLHFLNSAVQTCNNPPDDIVVPYINGPRPAEWWTQTDDKLLMYGAYMYGFGNYDEIKFTQPYTINMKALTGRLKSIIATLKNSYVRYKEEKGVDVQFNSETLQIIQDAMTKKDHKNIIFVLMNYGFTSHEEFRLISGMDSKNPETVDTYVTKLLSYCNYLNASKEQTKERKLKKCPLELNEGPKKEIGFPPELEIAKSEPKCSINSPDDAPWLAEPILSSQAQKIISRIKFFEEIREAVNNIGKYSNEEYEILCYIAEHGFINIADDPFINSLIGEEATDAKLQKKAKEIIKNYKPTKSADKECRPDKAIPTPHIDFDANGEPLMPIRLGPSASIVSMGKVVFDRPHFHSSRYIYPDGFVSLRQYTSVVNPKEKAWYRSSITDKGEQYPLFKVEVVDHPEYSYEGNAPSNPWIAILRDIEAKTKSNRALTISGPDYFNLANPVTMYLMKRMPNVDKCKKFKPQHYTDEPDQDMPEDYTELKPRRGRKRIIIFSDESDDMPLNLPPDEDFEEKKKGRGKKSNAAPKPNVNQSPDMMLSLGDLMAAPPPASNFFNVNTTTPRTHIFIDPQVDQTKKGFDSQQ